LEVNPLSPIGCEFLVVRGNQLLSLLRTVSTLVLIIADTFAIVSTDAIVVAVFHVRAHDLISFAVLGIILMANELSVCQIIIQESLSNLKLSCRNEMTCFRNSQECKLNVGIISVLTSYNKATISLLNVVNLSCLIPEVSSALLNLSAISQPFFHC